MRPISGAYHSSRPAGSGTITGQHGHGYRNGAHHRGHGDDWFAGKSWFGHHSWFNRNSRRHAGGSIRPAAAQVSDGVSAYEAPASAGSSAIAARPGAIADTNPRAGVTLPDKEYRAIIRATYPVALKLKPRVRHV